MTRIYIIRHAEAEGNLYRRIHGQYDSLVTPLGYRQIQALEKRFQDIHLDAVLRITGVADDFVARQTDLLNCCVSYNPFVKIGRAHV